MWTSHPRRSAILRCDRKNWKHFYFKVLSQTVPDVGDFYDECELRNQNKFQIPINLQNEFHMMKLFSHSFYTITGKYNEQSVAILPMSVKLVVLRIIMVVRIPVSEIVRIRFLRQVRTRLNSRCKWFLWREEIRLHNGFRFRDLSFLCVCVGGSEFRGGDRNKADLIRGGGRNLEFVQGIRFW